MCPSQELREELTALKEETLSASDSTNQFELALESMDREERGVKFNVVAGTGEMPLGQCSFLLSFGATTTSGRVPYAAGNTVTALSLSCAQRSDTGSGG